MKDAIRSAVVGVMLAVFVTALGAGGFALWRYRAASTGTVERYVVLGTVSGSEGGEVVAFALDVDAAQGEAEALDVFTDATIPGTSARTAHGAFPFGGGALVARALSDQTEGMVREWVVLPAGSWSAVFADGLDVTVPSALSVYNEGTLTVLPAGTEKLDGARMAALASAMDYMSDTERTTISAALAKAAATVVRSGDLDLAGFVEQGMATSSLQPSRIGAVE